MKKFAGLKAVLGNKFRLIKNNPKPYIIKGTVGALLVTTILAGCSNKEDNKQPIETSTPIEQTKEEDYSVIEDTKIEDLKDDFTFLSDTLKLDNVNIDLVTDQDTQEKADEIVPPTGDYDLENDEYTTDSTPVEDETKVEGNYYVAPDGSVWESEEEYKKYIDSQKENPEQQEKPTVEGNYFIAPDGSVWESEEEYNKFIESQDNNVNEDSSTGDDTDSETVEEDEDTSYKAPDGTYWESEQDYLDYINGPSVDEEDYFIAPDGSYWESEEEYNDYIKGYEDNNDEFEGNEEKISEETDYFVAPDGTYWESEAAYNEFISSSTNTEDTKTKDNETEENVTEEIVTEDTNTETEETEYYIDPEGNYWTSKAEYDAYMSIQVANGLTR